MQHHILFLLLFYIHIKCNILFIAALPISRYSGKRLLGPH